MLKCRNVGIYCDPPARILQVDSQDDSRLIHQAMPAVITPQTSLKAVGGRSTTVDHVLARALDEPLCRRTEMRRSIRVG